MKLSYILGVRDFTNLTRPMMIFLVFLILSGCKARSYSDVKAQPLLNTENGTKIIACVEEGYRLIFKDCSGNSVEQMSCSGFACGRIHNFNPFNVHMFFERINADTGPFSKNDSGYQDLKEAVEYGNSEENRKFLVTMDRIMRLKQKVMSNEKEELLLQTSEEFAWLIETVNRLSQEEERSMKTTRARMDKEDAVVRDCHSRCIAKYSSSVSVDSSYGQIFAAGQEYRQCLAARCGN